MGCYIDRSGAYYEGDQIGDDQEVPQRPSPLHRWNGVAWEIDPVAKSASIQAEIDATELATLMNRGERETLLRAMEKEAGEQSAALAAKGITKTPEEILAEVPAYVKFKALDDQVSALRVQL